VFDQPGVEARGRRVELELRKEEGVEFEQGDPGRAGMRRGNEGGNRFSSGWFIEYYDSLDSLIVLGNGLEQINALIQDHPYVGQNMIPRANHIHNQNHHPQKEPHKPISTPITRLCTLRPGRMDSRDDDPTEDPHPTRPDSRAEDQSQSSGLVVQSIFQL
jgi:hypothetical protein